MAKPVMRGKAGRGGFAELVFGFAITQISHTLLYDHGLKGAVEVGVSVPRGVGRPDLFRLGFEPTGPRCHFRARPLVRLDAGGLFLSMAWPQAFGARGTVLRCPASQFRSAHRIHLVNLGGKRAISQQLPARSDRVFGIGNILDRGRNGAK